MSRELLGASRGLFPCNGCRDAFEISLSRFVDGSSRHCDSQVDREARAAGCSSQTSPPYGDFLFRSHCTRNRWLMRLGSQVPLIKMPSCCVNDGSWDNGYWS